MLSCGHHVRRAGRSSAPESFVHVQVSPLLWRRFCSQQNSSTYSSKTDFIVKRPTMIMFVPRMPSLLSNMNMKWWEESNISYYVTMEFECLWIHFPQKHLRNCVGCDFYCCIHSHWVDCCASFAMPLLIVVFMVCLWSSEDALKKWDLTR